MLSAFDLVATESGKKGRLARFDVGLEGSARHPTVDRNVHFEPKEKHPGFPRSILVFDVKTQTWSELGEVPFSLVTTNAVRWRDQIVIPGGEARPGVRSPQVWSGVMK